MLRRCRLSVDSVCAIPARHYNTSRNAACAPAGAQCWKLLGPGACPGTPPVSKGPAEPLVGPLCGRSQLQRSSGFQYGPQSREGRGALGISKRCLRHKTTGGVPAMESEKSHVGFLGALTGAKGANSAIHSPHKTTNYSLCGRPPAK